MVGNGVGVDDTYCNTSGGSPRFICQDFVWSNLGIIFFTSLDLFD